ncbi:short chain dehydrogenase [Lentisphaera araneosa HTCC2155]|uniref:Short chain dehydrogenase n=1 Tax=Lentisphaera araneosa HTCC2155 TaxID=313628 RepID=A6DNZ9_9BACT|nr:bifunctional aldolase/short-chain dehydrogenase [Lentisphaera araneosa]EDM26531.1 short chain dehydrogenase [Lentisphaera araneosa HTCC2155]
MKSLWNDQEAAKFADDDLAMRVYTSRLLGQSEDLVLHGGGNTSVKSTQKDIFGNEVEVLYIKGSGWDLKTIEKAGFSPERQKECLQLAAMPELSDVEMVKQLRLALLDPAAPNGSIETLVHACIPFKYVDHSHADAIVVVSNSDDYRDQLEDLFPELLILPYVMPGFDLAKQFDKVVKDGLLEGKKGVILIGHGLFTFADDAKESYELHIEAVDKAEKLILEKRQEARQESSAGELNLLELAKIRKTVSDLRGSAVTIKVNQSKEAVGFSNRSDVNSIATRGTLTPDHSIRTKRTPVIIGDDSTQALESFKADHEAYFARNAGAEHTILDPAPRWGVWKGQGILSFGVNTKEAGQISDIAGHTANGIQDAEALGGWSPVSEKDLFEIEYWELEQRKLKKGGSKPMLQGQVAIVTGAAAGIGRKCAEDLMSHGALVVGIDISPSIESFTSASSLGLVCDIGKEDQLKAVVEKTVATFGGLDLIICNAGIFTAGEYVEDLDSNKWDATLRINLTANQLLVKYAAPYLKLGIEPAVLFVGSRNVGAPGPGAAAYSVSKAGLTQLARVLSLELAPNGIRVNVIHPDAVFDTDLWTPEALARSAERYGMTIEEYKTRNLLKTEIKSANIAEMCTAMVGPLFSKTTGAQVPVDGGNDRII